MTTQPFAVFGLLTIGACNNSIGSIAVVRRRTGLALPGGKVRPGETPEDALLRKFAAETGHSPVVSRVLHEERVDGELVRTYLVSLSHRPDPIEWATPDELIEMQSRKDLHGYNLSVLLAAGMPLAELGEGAWTAALGSGTLQYSKAGGSGFKDLYLHERCAFELGPEWDTISTLRITRGKPLALGDTRAWTEALWLARRIRFAGPAALRLQQHQPEWVTITEDGEVWEGLALLAHPVGLPWWPASRFAVAKLAQWQAGKFVQ